MTEMSQAGHWFLMNCKSASGDDINEDQAMALACVWKAADSRH